MTDLHDPFGLGAERRKVRLMIWDAPNITWQVQDFLRRPPTPRERPRMHQVLDWLRKRTAKDEVLMPLIFVNRPKSRTASLKQTKWLEVMNSIGYYTHAKPRLETGSDIDEEMVGWLLWFYENHDLVEVIIASNDAKRFFVPLKRLATAGVPVSILGLSTINSRLRRSPLFGFISFESIPGVLKITPPSNT